MCRSGGAGEGHRAPPMFSNSQENSSKGSRAARELATVFSVTFSFLVTMVGQFVKTTPVHRLLGNFSATLGFSNACQLAEQLSVHGATFSLCVSTVTVMLLLRVKQ